MERLGLNSTADLPALGDFVPAAEVVEALEQTLRVEVEADPEIDSDAAAETDSEPELVIDLTDGAGNAQASEVPVAAAGSDVDEA